MRIIALTALALVAFVSTASAQNAKSVTEELVREISMHRDSVCPKQTMPDLCKLEFGGAIIFVNGVNIQLGRMMIAIMKDDEAKEAEIRRKIDAIFDEMPTRLNKLTEKYGR